MADTRTADEVEDAIRKAGTVPRPSSSQDLEAQVQGVKQLVALNENVTALAAAIDRFADLVAPSNKESGHA